MNQSFDQVLNFIHQADDAQISEIIQAVIKRYARVFPEWEVTFLSLPKNDPTYRRQILRSLLQSYEHP